MILSSTVFETVKSQWKEKRKSLILAKLVSFLNFSNFWKFETDFGIKLKKWF